jgi:hypothetical protein
MSDILTAQLPDCSSRAVAALLDPHRQPETIGTANLAGEWITVWTNGTPADREAARAELLAAMAEVGSAAGVLRFQDEES